MSLKVKKEHSFLLVFKSNLYKCLWKKKLKYPEEQTQLHVPKPLIPKKPQLPYLPAVGIQTGKVTL